LASAAEAQGMANFVERTLDSPFTAFGSLHSTLLTLKVL